MTLKRTEMILERAFLADDSGKGFLVTETNPLLTRLGKKNVRPLPSSSFRPMAGSSSRKQVVSLLSSFLSLSSLELSDTKVYEP